MSTKSEVSVGPAAECVVGHELGHLRKHWWWLALLGALLVVCGTVAIVFPVFASVAVVAVLAAILMVAGVATIIGAFWAGKWSGFLLHLLVGFIYVAASLAVSDRPTAPREALLIITVFIAAAFMVMGAFRVLASLLMRFPQWGWSLLNGLVTFLAGFVIFRQLPWSAFWAVGLLVGLEMLFNGWTWIMLAMAIKNLPAETHA
jgi:uncharacterized membrane protein HdeD (DUF308 family)